MRKDTGAHYEILVNGKILSWRDDYEFALFSAPYVKSKQLNSEVAVRDDRDGKVTAP